MEEAHHPTSLGTKLPEIVLVAIVATVYFFMRSTGYDPITVAIVGFIVALWAIMRPTEWAVEGLKLLAEKMGVGTYAAGVLGSIMANLPELILATLLILRGESKIGILTVLVVAGANTLLFGVVIIKTSIKRGGNLKVPATTLRYESDLMMVAFITALFLFVYNFAEGITGKLDYIDGVPQVKIPVLYSIGTVAIYVTYLIFLAKDKDLTPHASEEDKLKVKEHSAFSWGNIAKFLLFGVIGIVIAGELLANGAEILIEEAASSGTDLGEAQVALIVGALGSLPEWAIAFKAGDDLELVFGNVLSSISATLLLMIGLISVFIYMIGGIFELDPYAMVQIVLSGSILLFVNLLMRDDLELDTFEGISIVIIQIVGFDVLLSV